MFSALLAGTIFALSLGSALARVAFTGVNIAGFEFGAHTDGSCSMDRIYGPYRQLRYGNNPDGEGQMIHFTSKHGMNMYRLPVAWQFLVDGKLGGALSAKNFGDYDKLVQACLATGSHCLIDLHNFARWNGAIIGQGGPSNDDFANVWGQLAAKYAGKSKMAFGLMNEPHDIPDIDAWGGSVQAAVTAIRKAGATSQMILMPGTDYTSAQTFVSSGSAAALAKVKNPDGSTQNLIFDVHKYLDKDNSGTHPDCVSNMVDSSFAPLAKWLRSNNRQALLSETGGGRNDPSCLQHVCEALRYIEDNSDVYLGYLGWSAGSFAPDYILALTPFGDAKSGWKDQELLTKCFAAGGGSGPAPKPSTTPEPLPKSAAPSIIGAKTFAVVIPGPGGIRPVAASTADNPNQLGVRPTKTSAKHTVSTPRVNSHTGSPNTHTTTLTPVPSPAPEPAPEPRHSSQSSHTAAASHTKSSHSPKKTTSAHHNQYNQHSSSGFATATKTKATSHEAPAKGTEPAATSEQAAVPATGPTATSQEAPAQATDPTHTSKEPVAQATKATVTSQAAAAPAQTGGADEGGDEGDDDVCEL